MQGGLQLPTVGSVFSPISLAKAIGIVQDADAGHMTEDEFQFPSVASMFSSIPLANILLVTSLTYDQKQQHCQQPVHAAAGVVEWHTSQFLPLTISCNIRFAGGGSCKTNELPAPWSGG